MKQPRADWDNDKQLMFRAAKGDRQAFTQLCDKFQPRLRGYLASRNGQLSSLDDLTQEVFTRLWQQRGQFKGKSTVKTYLFGIANNVIREEAARQLQLGKLKDLTIGLQQTIDRFKPPRQGELSQPEQDAYYQELRASLRDAVRKLPAIYRQAIGTHLIDLVPLNQGSNSEESPEPSAAAARQRLARALQMLRALINT